MKDSDKTKKNDGIDTKKQDIASIPGISLRDVVVFPSMVIPLFVGREKSITALNIAMDSSGNNFDCPEKSRSGRSDYR